MDSDLKRKVEALLFAAPEALSLDRIKSIIPRCDKRALRAVMEELHGDYDSQGHAFQLCQIAGGWRVMTRPEYTRQIEEMLKGRRKVRLSKASLEVLSVVAYRQPCGRIDVDEVRGVNSGGPLATLLERGMLRITGRAERLGRPLLYGTTDEFLSYMGLSSIEDLPNLTEIEALLAASNQEQAEDTPVASEERRLRLVEGMDNIAEFMGEHGEEDEDEPRTTPLEADVDGDENALGIMPLEVDIVSDEDAMPDDADGSDDSLDEASEETQRLLRAELVEEVATLSAAPALDEIDSSDAEQDEQLSGEEDGGQELAEEARA